MPNLTIEHLKKRSEFVTVAKAGERQVTPAFIVQAYRRPSNDLCRIGITASRKIGGAVERNRAKRRLRALSRAIFPSKGASGIDYVLIAREEVLSCTFAFMEKELEIALSKLHERIKSVNETTEL